MSTIVIMPGGFHPFHAGHADLYQQAKKAFPGADIYVAATNDQSERPFPFALKEKLAKLAGVESGHFVQVKSPFQAKEITQHYNPEQDVLIFVRSEKDRNEPPKPGGTKKDGSPAYFQPYTGKDLQPFSQHAYIDYLKTVEFGPGITSATQIRNAWPTLNDKRKTALVMSLYPAAQKNLKLAKNIVGMFDQVMGGQVDEGWKDVVAGGAMALGALGAGAQTMPDINVQRVELANKYYNVLVQRAKEDGIKLDTRTLNVIKAKAQDAAAKKTQQSTYQQGFSGQGSERKVAKDAGQFESQGVAEGAPMVVMPMVPRPKKAEPTKVRYQGDIVPPTQPPSTEKRGVKGRPGQRPMPDQGVTEQTVTETAEELQELTQFSKVMADFLANSYTQYIKNPQTAEYVQQQISQPITDGATYRALMPVISIGSVPGADAYTSPGLELAKKFVSMVVAYFPAPGDADYYGFSEASPAVYDAQTRTVVMNKDYLSNPAQMAGTVAHEVQHGIDDLKSRKGLSVNTDDYDLELSHYNQGKAFKYTQSGGTADKAKKYQSYLAMPHEVNARFTEVINDIKQRIEKEDIQHIGSAGLSDLARSAFEQHYMHEVFPNGAKDPGYKRLLSRVYAWLSKYYNDRIDRYGSFKPRPATPVLEEQGVAEGASLSVEQLAHISDKALDDAYHYGRSTPGANFGWMANMQSAKAAKRLIDAGETDIEVISDAIHKGWNVTAAADYKGQLQLDTPTPEDKKLKRAKLAMQSYSQLPEEEKEKDRVVARALLTALRGKIDETQGLPYPSTYGQETEPLKSHGARRIVAMTNEDSNMSKSLDYLEEK